MPMRSLIDIVTKALSLDVGSRCQEPNNATRKGDEKSRGTAGGNWHIGMPDDHYQTCYPEECRCSHCESNNNSTHTVAHSTAVLAFPARCALGAEIISDTV